MWFYLFFLLLLLHKSTCSMHTKLHVYLIDTMTFLDDMPYAKETRCMMNGWLKKIQLMHNVQCQLRVLHDCPVKRYNKNRSAVVFVFKHIYITYTLKHIHSVWPTVKELEDFPTSKFFFVSRSSQAFHFETVVLLYK